MAKREKQTTMSEARQRERTRVPMPLHIPSSSAPATEGNEPWRKYKVKPDTTAMPLDTEIDPERGIGARIAFCRGQLGNLSVEALSRYTKNFDQDGISRSTLVRYESGDFLPGARELRILVDALWVPAGWLLFGAWELPGTSAAAAELVDAFGAFVDARTGGLPDLRGRVKRDKEEREERLLQEIATRQRWLHEARNP